MGVRGEIEWGKRVERREKKRGGRERVCEKERRE